MTMLPINFALSSIWVRKALRKFVFTGGRTEWTGEWSDSSPLWTAELKAELGFTAKNDGTFWMSLRGAPTSSVLKTP